MPTTSKEFIRLLTKTIIEHSLDQSMKLNDDAFKQNVVLLKHFIGENEGLAEECLFGVQQLMDQLEYPSGKNIFII